MTNLTQFFDAIELWADIPNLNGIYQVSTLGNVRSMARIRRGHFYPMFLLKKSLKKNGYYTVSLSDSNGLNFAISVHKLMANVFLPEIEGYDQVNHINGIKSDNRLTNIERCNRSQNMKHAIKMGLFIPNNWGRNKKVI